MNSNLIETIPGWPYSLVDARYKDNDGVIVDLGCLTWNWSKLFIDEGRRVIGVDPQEVQIAGTELFPGVVGPFTGMVKMNLGPDQQISTLVDAGNARTYVDMLSWKDFCKSYGIDKIAILKINIESSEYPLLASMNSDDFVKIDQIAISLHDWLNPAETSQKDSALDLLRRNGFEIIRIYSTWGWYLATKQK